ncbi:MAG: Panacea domain-containing protein [Pyrinomonadaceae bacterium]
MFFEELSTKALSAKVRTIVGKVQATFERETGEFYEPQLIEDALTVCVGNALNRLEDGMLEMFTTPGRREFEELGSLLEKHVATANAAVEVEEMVYLAEEHNDESVFEGFRPYSHDKLAAMIEYLTSKGNLVYKTSLNKLLFYSDLTMFYLRSHGMSGAVYYNRPFGPVAEVAEPVLNYLIANEKIKVAPFTKTLEAASADSPDILTADEKKVLDWVAQTYGSMGAGQISEHSHKEMAYRYTEPNEKIAYAYGKFFKHLPPRSLLDH